MKNVPSSPRKKFSVVAGVCLIGMALLVAGVLNVGGGRFLPRRKVAPTTSPTLRSGEANSVEGPTSSTATPSNASSGVQLPSSNSAFPGGGSVGIVGTGPIVMQPAYSPDGRQIVFVTDQTGEQHLWIVNTDGSGLRQLTLNMNPSDPMLRSAESDPAWSPNGSLIAFTGNVVGNMDIWTVRPDGTNLTRLTTDQAKHMMPVWSPDSLQIVYVSSSAGAREIWVMNANGTNARQLTRLGAALYPSFSPDGRQIVFSAPQDVGSNLMLMNADGTGLSQLTTGAFYDLHPRWSTRGIVFDSNRSGTPALWIIQPNGSGLQLLPGTEGREAGVSADGTKVAFSATGLREFNFVDNTTREVVKVTGFSIATQLRAISPNGDISLAILSSSNFAPVQQVNQSSITFGLTGDDRSLLSCAADSSRGTGVPDLTCNFSGATAGVGAGSPWILRARDVDQTRLEGRGTIPSAPTPCGPPYAELPCP